MNRRFRNTSITLTANQSCVISEDLLGVGKRIALEVGNLQALGGADVFMSVSAEAAANQGRRLQPGQDKVWSTDGGYIPPQNQITAFSTVAAVLSIYEEIEA